MSAGFTPGPWVAELRPSRMWHIHGQPVIGVGGNRGAVAFTGATYSEAGRALSAANARLIAAAPALLKALDELRNYADHLPDCPGNHGGTCECDFNLAILEGRAALALARGESPHV